MTSKKRLFLLLLAFFVCVLMMNFIMLLTLLVIKVYLYFFQGVPFMTYSWQGLYKLARGATFGGIALGFGCLFAHYMHIRSRCKK
ncbi:hypothetical protein N7922_25230 (plasmid) [Kosakonia sp. ML.JS2a]|uniref:hypothetical protein n=1 Tax=Kosakonia sp. ML.JS2a TaxID=2980557 RepID=UPI0021DA69F9|nr:hypothetical protein [Kosakonia sp. ML.JS2a]UXY13541.1 hypothetical protein N7922_25230 [Kosakonia sp. ML.JS2a]